MSVIDIFSVPILVHELDSSEGLRREDVELLKSIKMNKQHGDDGNYLSEDAHILQQYKLSKVYDICNKYVKLYTEELLGISDEFKMFKSWLSMNTKGTKHLAHSHRNTMISCVLYFDEDMSNIPMAPINFGQDGLDNIFRTFQFGFNRINRNQYNNNILTIYPKTNTLIVFPGWVRHETEEATSTTKRYCIGSNYFFVGESAGGYHNISIDVS